MLWQREKEREVSGCGVEMVSLPVQRISNSIVTGGVSCVSVQTTSVWSRQKKESLTASAGSSEGHLLLVLHTS